MKNVFYFISLLSIFLLFSCESDNVDTLTPFCQDNPGSRGCPGFEPCSLVLPADSDFLIVDSTMTFAADTFMSVEVDSSFGVYLYFRPRVVNRNASYAWRIGQDPRVWTEPAVTLNFTGFEGTIDVSLDVTVPEDDCLTEDQLVSVTTTKTVTIVDNCCYYPTTGVFNGTLTRDGVVEDDDISITITDNSLINTNTWWRLYGLPIPEHCNSLIQQGFRLRAGYHWLVSNTTLSLSESYCTSRRPLVLGRLTPGDSNEMNIDYWIDDDNGQRIHRQFVGRRVQ